MNRKLTTFSVSTHGAADQLEEARVAGGSLADGVHQQQQVHDEPRHEHAAALRAG